MRSNSILSVIAGLLLLLPTPLLAAMATYDAATHYQTILTAAQTARMELQQIRDYVIQIKKMEAAIKNAKNLPGEVLDEIKREIEYDVRILTDYEGAVSDSYGSLNDLGNYLDNVYRRQAASDLTTEQWLQRERDLAAQGNAAAKTEILAGQQLLEKNRKHMERRRELQKGIENDGLNESVQKTNQYMDIVTSQNAALGNLLTADAAARATERAEAAADRERNAQLRARAEKESRAQGEEIARRLKGNKAPTFGLSQ